MRRGRGFTYVEIAVVMAIAAMFLLLALGLSSGSRRRVDAKAAAEVLASALSSAREQARASGQPVGVVFPTANGTRPCSQSCEFWQGWTPRQLRVLDLKQDFGDCVMFGGTWDAPGFSTARPQWGTSDDAIDPATWLPGRGQDRLLLFLPSGHVLGHGVARLDNGYVLVLGSELATEAAAAPAEHRLVGAGSAYTLHVSSSGFVQQSAGVLHGAHLPRAVAATVPAAGSAAVPVLERPVVVDVRITPDPAKLQLPGGVEAMVESSAYLTLGLSARGRSGEALFYRWESEDPGAFSHVELRPMQWDAVAGVWRGDVHWRPPHDAGEGSRYRLDCLVEDESGRRAISDLTSQVFLEVRGRKARMAYITIPAAGTQRQMLVINEDGTGRRDLPVRIENIPHTPKASWSPDGTRLAYFSQQGSGAQLWTCSADGSGARRIDAGLAGTAAQDNGVFWSPDGSWLAHIRLDGEHATVWLLRPDGSSPTQLSNNPGVSSFFALKIASGSLNSDMTSRDNNVFSPDGRYVAALATVPASSRSAARIELYPVPGEGGTARTVPTGGSVAWNIVWNPVRDWLAFASGSGVKIYDVGNSAFVPVSYQGNTAGPGCFSPDGSKYVFSAGINLFQTDLTLNPAPVTPLPGGLQGAAMGWIDDERLTFWDAQTADDLWVFDFANGDKFNLTQQPGGEMFCGWSK